MTAHMHPRAGQQPHSDELIDLEQLKQAYSHPTKPLNPVAFGTSGHRGTSLSGSYNEAHILAITQALCEYRAAQGVDGPLFIGFDTHALSECSFQTALRVLAANGVEVRYQAGLTPTPTPVISHAILNWNRNRDRELADGIVITPSHNPPQDGGFKYNPIDGGPANTDITNAIEKRANALIAANNAEVNALGEEEVTQAPNVQAIDLIQPYVDELGSVIDMEAIKKAGVKIGVDPLGGASLPYWEPIAKTYGLDITVVNTVIDPTFSFMPIDRDGKIRMDCSSPWAMSGLIKFKDDFDIAFGTDPDADRHGIVTRSSGLLNPNHYLAVAIGYLVKHRPNWKPDLKIGKTLVSSSMIDRVVAELGREVCEVPVGFKWFVDGLFSGTFAFGGEESAGASFLRKDGSAWSTDKDGIILCLLAAEIIAVTGKDPGTIYGEYAERFGAPVYDRIDAPANAAQKNALKHLAPDDITANTLAGDPITRKLSHAPGNGAAIGGIKVETAHGWFAARPSGTEEVYKIYAESFKSEEHLRMIQQEAQAIVDTALAG
ncbi:MAG: phosphoglucomutase [Verrucomicrobiales bacterium]|jgi:phosphoglucomutase